nr:hypothetical protein [Parachlamydiaceae bacterium]
MKLFSKLSLNPEDPLAVREAIEHALDIGLSLKPNDLIPLHIQKLIKKIDHIGFSANLKTIPIILQYQKEHGFFLRCFKSTIASKEFENDMIIYELKGGSLPLEIMVPIDNISKYPQHHVAFSTHQEEDLIEIISSFNESIKLPGFMNGIMKNQQESVTAIYLDGGPVRLEFVYRG